MRIVLCFLILTACQFVPPSSNSPKNFHGRVDHVSDGDTFWVVSLSGERKKIRLYGIDAPEKKQPYGEQSTAYLKALLHRKEVRVVWNKTDPFGRIIGRVYLHQEEGSAPIDINRTMIQNGMAWHFKPGL